MKVPLGVARVLIGDLSRSGVLSGAPGRDARREAQTVALMNRVLDGLRQL